RQIQTSASGCGSLTTNVVTITVYPQFIVGSIGASQAICYNTVPTALTGIAPTGGNTAYGYQWQKSADNAVFSNISGATSLNFAPTALTSTTYYRQIQTSASGCGSLTTNVVTITVYPQFIVGSIGASQAICYNTVPAALTGIAPTGGNLAYGYQWQKSADNAVFSNIFGATSLNFAPTALTATTYYRQIQTSASGCGSLTTNVAIITVYPNIVAGSIAADQVVSQFEIPAQLIGSAPTGGNPPYLYQWEKSDDNVTFATISGATSINYQPGLLTATTWFRQIQSSTCGEGVATNVVTITVSLLPPPELTIFNIVVDSNQTQCYNATQTITVAGGLTTFLVKSGGSVNLIAGYNILMLAGTKVDAGGYLHGYITNSGQYCVPMNSALPGSQIGVIEKIEKIEKIGEIEKIGALAENSADATFRCYPNPTPGRFTLSLSTEPGETPVIVKIYNILGVEVSARTIYSGKLHEFSLENQSSGIYMLSIVQNGKVGIVKVVRQ
ncbi:MAG: T9SS type A sorting domain-containing protein, partial [Bacteroidetes bacterium]|nr:T9SS type A sorting domain-containing protein [Bacteroidota bacterium]